MNYDTELKLKELFKKHLDLSLDRPQMVWAKNHNLQLTEDDVVTDELFENQFYYNMEYFKWRWNHETNDVEFYGPDVTLHPFHFMGIFSEQEDKLPIIKQEFTSYIKDIINYIVKSVTKESEKLRKSDVPVGKICLSYKWSFIVESLECYTLLGVPVEISEESEEEKIESESQYGRFITFAM